MKRKSQTSKQIIYSIIAIGLMVTLFTKQIRHVSAEPNLSNPGTTNLVAWWSLNENTGTRNDSHSTNHLTENAQPVNANTGKQGNAAEFIGNNNNLGIGDNPEISMGDIDFSIGGWVNIEQLGALRALMGKRPVSGANQGYEFILEYDYTPNQFWSSVGNGTTYGSITHFTPSTNTWHFLVAWHDSVNDMIYLQVDNGTPASASYSGGSYDSFSNLLIGRAGEYYGGFMDGLIDEAFIYKRVLTENERTWLYNSGNGRSYFEINPIPPTPTPTITLTPTITNTPTISLTPSKTPTRPQQLEPQLELAHQHGLLLLREHLLLPRLILHLKPQHHQIHLLTHLHQLQLLFHQLLLYQIIMGVGFAGQVEHHGQYISLLIKLILVFQLHGMILYINLLILGTMFYLAISPLYTHQIMVS